MIIMFQFSLVRDTHEKDRNLPNIVSNVLFQSHKLCSYKLQTLLHEQIVRKQSEKL